MKISRGIIITFFILVFQNCKTKKSVFNDTNIDINQNISYKNTINYNSYNYKNKESVFSSQYLENKPDLKQSKLSNKNVKNFIPTLENEINKNSLAPIKEVREHIKTGPIKTIRKGFVIIATILLITAIILLFFALLKWQSVFLLWSSLSAGISYFLFKLGKKRLNTNWIDADKKQLKQLKKMALLVSLVSGLIYLITLVF